MPENTPQTYTPTPWVPEHTGVMANKNIIGNDEAPVCTVRYPHSSHPFEGNKAIIIASVNSYARHCGPNAIQCAEGDLLGEALDALKQVQSLLATDGVRRAVGDRTYSGVFNNIYAITSRLTTEQGVES